MLLFIKKVNKNAEIKAKKDKNKTPLNVPELETEL